MDNHYKVRVQRKKFIVISKQKKLLDQYPLLRDAHLICEQKIQPKVFLENLGKHPEFDRNKPQE